MSCDLINAVLSKARQLGADQAEVGISRISGFNVAVRMQQVETVEHNNDIGLDLTVYFGQRSGSASSTDLSPEAWQLALEKACHIAKFTEADSCAGLADGELMATNYPDLDLYHPWTILPDQAIDIALICESNALNYNELITNSGGVNLSSHSAAYYYGNSHGFCGHYQTSRHGMDCSLVAELGGEKQRDYDFTVARVADDLWSPEQLALSSVERTVKRLGAKSLSSRNCPVIFAPQVAKSIWQALLSAISGSNQYRQTSFLLDALGQKLLPDFVNLVEEPHRLRALGSAPYDAEGVATRAKSIIEAGVLQTYLLSSYSARKLQRQTTGNAGGVHNLVVEGGEHDLAGLLQLMGTGLLVTEMIGQGVNIVTGDYSRGAFGYWVENGRIQYPVHEITLAGNLKQMFNDIIAIGNDIDQRSNIITGSLLLEAMSLAGGA